MDETYIKVKGSWCYLYRTIDEFGQTIDIWLRKRRDKKAAYSFFKRILKEYGKPKYIVTDKAPSIESALKTLDHEGYHPKHRRIKYLNNMIESDHRFIKKRFKLYKNLRSASKTIKGIEVMHALYKEQKNRLSFYSSVFLPCQEIENMLAA